MADVNASVGGTLNQDPFSVNMADGVGQGREPDISPTAPDDEMNKDADKLDFLNDTDHSMMPNDTNMLQSMQEMMAESDSGDHEFRGDFHTDQQTLESLFDQMDYLKKLKRKITARGISTGDIYSLESKYPNMLIQVGNGFTLESNDSNVEFALEAIDSKIGSIVLAIGRTINRIIDFIINRFKALDSWFANSKLKAMLIYLKSKLSKRELLLTPAEALEKVPRDVFEKYFESKVNVDSFNRAFKSDLALDSLSGLPKRFTTENIIKLLASQQGTAPAYYNDMEMIYEIAFRVNGDVDKIIGLLSQAEDIVRGKMTDVPDVTVEEYKKLSVVDLKEYAKISLADAETDLSKMYRTVQYNTKRVGTIKDSIKKLDMAAAKMESPEQAEAYKKILNAVRAMLLNIQLGLHDVNANTTAYSVAVKTVISIHDCLNSTNIAKLAESHRAETSNIK